MTSLKIASSYQLLFSLKYLFSSYKTSYLNEEVNCTEPSPEVRIPWWNIYVAMGWFGRKMPKMSCVPFSAGSTLNDRHFRMGLILYIFSYFNSWLKFLIFKFLLAILWLALIRAYRGQHTKGKQNKIPKKIIEGNSNGKEATVNRVLDGSMYPILKLMHSVFGKINYGGLKHSSLYL